MLYAPLVDKVLEWFLDVLWSVITDDLVGSAKKNSDTAFLISSVTFSLVVACRGVTMGYFEK